MRRQQIFMRGAPIGDLDAALRKKLVPIFFHRTDFAVVYIFVTLEHMSLWQLQQRSDRKRKVSCRTQTY